MHTARTRRSPRRLKRTITNTGSAYNPCHGNMPQLLDALKRGVLMAGGLPMDFPTLSIHESFSAPTSMYLRNLMSMDTEELIRDLRRTHHPDLLAAISAIAILTVLTVFAVLSEATKREAIVQIAAMSSSISSNPGTTPAANSRAMSVSVRMP